MSDIPRPEYPRPNLRRANWLNLNGEWRFAFDPQLIGEQERWYFPSRDVVGGPASAAKQRSKAKNLRITVPFPWESPLSGVERPDYKGAAWYERTFTVPAEWAGQAPFLNFGAIDWHARVWINGRFAAENDNGYLPFSVDLRHFVQPGETATVTVRAFDVADATTLVGKQVPWWYTHSSGIWQTVWLEPRAASHVEQVRIAPDVANEQAQVRVDLSIAQAGRYNLRLSSPGGDFPVHESSHDLQPGNQTVEVALAVPNPRLWSPNDPYLYDVEIQLFTADEVTDAVADDVVDDDVVADDVVADDVVADDVVADDVVADDVVATYFGMRTVGRGGWNGKTYEYILLNGEPVYLRGALDQAFHPDSLHAYPSDDVIRDDVQLAKDLGLNMLRCHIKINDPRYYYWADKLGVLMMYDLPSPDLDTPTMRRIYEQALPAAIARDYNSPSIFAWVLFNETWGLTEHQLSHSHRWVQKMLHWARDLDPTRLIEDNSPCHYNHVESDINSWHYYINDYHQVRRHIQQVVDQTYPGSSFNYVGGEYVQETAPLMNSEYGGIAARSGDQDIAWCFKYQTTELRRHDKICGYVYTELDDIEWEHNGFVNYDRSAKEFGYDHFVPDMTVADLNAADFVGLDAPPCRTLAPGATFCAPIFVSHWGEETEKLQVRWQLDFIDRFGETRVAESGNVAVDARRFDVTDLGELAIALPDEPGLATLALWLVDDAGTIRCRNYVNVEVRAGDDPAHEQTADGWAIRFAPGDLVATSWPRPFVDPAGDKFSASAAGWVEYNVELPADVDLAAARQVRLRFEASARAGMAKVDWPQRTYGFNYPQTEEVKTPTEIDISVNGVEVARIHLPDDPADARGVLSHHHAVEPGSYGYLTDLKIDGATLASIVETDSGEGLRVRFAVAQDGEHGNGFALYGAQRGSTPVAPTLFVDV